MVDLPVTEMLWEDDDPITALRERFGLDGRRAAEQWIAATLGEYWGLRVLSCPRIVMSDHNALAWLTTPSGRRVAKWSVAPTRFPLLSQLAHLTRWLGSRSLPVSAPVPALDGRTQVETGGISIGLQHVIDGDLLDVDDPEQVHAAGRVLARLQDALAEYPDAGRIGAPPGSPVPLAERIGRWLDHHAAGLPAVAHDRLRTLIRRAGDAPVLPAVQLLHFDFRSANLVCSGRQVAAVLDFEQVRFDHRIVELARSAVVLGTRFRDWGPIADDVRARFLAGYGSARALTDGEAAWWDAVLLWQALVAVPNGDDPTGWGASAIGLTPGANAIRPRGPRSRSRPSTRP